MRRGTFGIAAIALVASLSGTVTRAQEDAQHDVGDLAKKTQNPVGDLVSVPFQFNFNGGGGLEDGTFFNLNIQPVIPFKLTDNWTAIARTIIPVDSLPGPTASSSASVATSRRSSSSHRRSRAPSSGA